MLKYQTKHGIMLKRFRHGELHGKYSASVILENCYAVWCEYDQTHRKDGPAVIQASGRSEYWIRGKEIVKISGG